jgi:TPR repeat protein
LGLGKAYAEGRGVQKDPVKAYACFALSSDLGNQEGETALNQLGAALSRSQLADARALVGQMYAAGVVAPVNQVAAYTWLTLAESAGSKKASQEKLTVASKLSKVEVTRAIEGAQQWQRSHRR